MPNFWNLTDTPWVRTKHEPSWQVPSTGYLQCLFCGEVTLKLSVLDNSQDTARVEFYCDNTSCDAREITLLVMRGAEAHRRADVRALRAIDQGDATVEEREPELRSLELNMKTLGEDIASDRARAVASRTSTDPLRLEF